MFTEKRRHNRVPCNLEIVISGGPKSIEAISSDLSESGMATVTSKHFIPMTEYEVTVKLPHSLFEDNCINCSAVVIWSKKRGNSKKYDTGFLFYDISHKNLIKIRSFVDYEINKLLTICCSR
jgi:c-di-GMP-binding flagellar brake protein YcgR